ncbi:arginyl-tRNA synthetase [Zopfia rhizophila CBS 207.26]|uniref:arginine--tRNA ligase n=1 Tax=Zopfia rhizophila CBS 207.26 TaxID=1314779 RepID=A0A6A6DZG8_9PEZI|nr:arginyl-tRNA synthetase [Zopfia rhizophila CBS 207.26]
MATSTVAELEGLLGGLDLKTPIPPFPSSDVLKSPLDICRSYLADILCSLVDCDPVVAYNSIQWPNNIFNGDLTVILPKLSPGANASELAFDLMKKFSEYECPLFLLPFPEGVHLRIMLMPHTLPRLLLPYINDRKGGYGSDVSLGLKDPSSPESGRKKVVVEFSSPNIAKDFEGKHLRSTILGAFVSNIYETMGWDVTKINYLGDWGKPIGLLGVGWEKFGSEEAFQADPVGHLLDVYHKVNELFIPELVASRKLRDEGGDPAEIEGQGLFAERNAFFKKMEDGDEEALALFKRVRDVNIDNFTKLYARLNISFDEYSGESQVSPDVMAEVEQMLKEKGVLEESGGAWIIDMKKHGGRAGVAIIRDRAGGSTYLLRDLAAVLERSRKFEFDKMIFVVAADHNVHFSRLFKILELLEMSDLAGKLQHVHFNEVSQMSEKLGPGHQPHEILDQCETAMLGVLEADEEKAALLGDPQEAATVVGMTALLAQELAARRANDHIFDISGMTSFKLSTGPELQYWYAKLCSILKTHPGQPDLSDEEFASLAEEEPANLLRVLAQYPDVTHAAFKSMEPSTIMTYLVSVIDQLSLCFEAEEVARVVEQQTIGEIEDVSGQDTSVSPGQAMLYEATRRVLENGMKLLGLTPATKVEPDRVDTPVAE